MNESRTDIPDYHTHNERCKHATGVTADYARAARESGLREFAATDHCPTDCGFGQDHRMELSEFPGYVDDVLTARADNPDLDILLGIEADYYPGCESFLKSLLDQHPFDVVLGSVHFRSYWSSDPTKRGLADGDAPSTVWQEYFALIGRLANSGLYDVVAHIDLPKRFGNKVNATDFRRYAMPALEKIAHAGMAIEINTSGMIHSVNEMYPSAELLQWAAELGIGLTFGSDSHKPDRVGDGFDDARELALASGYTEARRYRGRTWTTYSLLG